MTIRAYSRGGNEVKLTAILMIAAGAAWGISLPDKDAVVITSDPPGATVLWNRRQICTTPCTYTVGEYAFNARKSTIFSKHLAQPVVLHVALDGYQSKDSVITKPWLWRSLNGRNAFTDYTIPQQEFFFTLNPVPPPPTYLSNADIIEMQFAQLGEGVILEKIADSENAFDLKTPDLVVLRDAGVSAAVIQAMLRSPRAAAAPVKPRPVPAAVENSSPKSLRTGSGETPTEDFDALGALGGNDGDFGGETR